MKTNPILRTVSTQRWLRSQRRVFHSRFGGDNGETVSAGSTATGWRLAAQADESRFRKPVLLAVEAYDMTKLQTVLKYSHQPSCTIPRGTKPPWGIKG